MLKIKSACLLLTVTASLLSGCAISEEKKQELIVLQTTVEPTSGEEILVKGTWLNANNVSESGYFTLTNEAIHMSGRAGMTQGNFWVVLRYTDLTEAKATRFLLDPVEVSVHHKTKGKLNLKTMEISDGKRKFSDAWTEPKEVVEIINEQIKRHQTAN